MAKQKMGRPDIRQAEVRNEEVREQDVKPKKTRTRKGGMTDQLAIPDHLRVPGMDYQWVTDSVLGQAVPQTRMSFEANGWEPVPAEAFPGLFMPKGFQGEINVGGLVLMTRPMELTMEARAEDRAAAVAPRRTQERKLRSGDIDGVTLDTQHPSAKANTFVRSEIVAGSIPVPE